MLEKIKSAYIVWHGYHDIFPKTQRYSLGNRIDRIFIELIEATATACFLSQEKKLLYVALASRKLDLLKVFLMIAWETQALDTPKYITLSLPLDEAGRMLGGWSGKLEKQNSPAEAREK